VFAHYFGASPVADAWRAALKLPNILQNLLGEGTLSAAYIPIYSELLSEGRIEDSRRFSGAVLGLLMAAATLAAALGILIAPALVRVFYWGFDPERQALTVTLVRILFPMTALLVVSAWALGTLNSHRTFFLPYVAPVGWNLSMIGALLLGGAWMGAPDDRLIRWLAWGGVVGGGVQLALQLPTLTRLTGGIRPSLSLHVEGVQQALRNFFPIFMARGVVNVGSWLDLTLASFLTAGAVASLGYAQLLYLLPISLFGLAVAASELPELSRGSARTAPESLTEELAGALRRSVYFLLPSVVAYILLGEVLLKALFESGAFGPDATRVTWLILVAYALGIPASALSRVLASGFYALQDTGTPARIAYRRVGISLLVGAILMVPLDQVAIGSLALGAAGLALGATLAAWIEFLSLARALTRRIGPLPAPLREVAMQLVVALLAGTVALLLLGALPPLHRWIEALLSSSIFGAVYLGGTALLGVANPARELFASARGVR